MENYEVKFCPECGLFTEHKTVLYNPDNPDEGECWECQICHELTQEEK